MAQPVAPKREAAHPGFWSRYRWWWRGCKWELFLAPTQHGFEGARRPGKETIQALPECPGEHGSVCQPPP